MTLRANPKLVYCRHFFLHIFYAFMETIETTNQLKDLEDFLRTSLESLDAKHLENIEKTHVDLRDFLLRLWNDNVRKNPFLGKILSDVGAKVDVAYREETELFYGISRPAKCKECPEEEFENSQKLQNEFDEKFNAKLREQKFNVSYTYFYVISIPNTTFSFSLEIAVWDLINSPIRLHCIDLSEEVPLRTGRGVYASMTYVPQFQRNFITKNCNYKKYTSYIRQEPTGLCISVFAEYDFQRTFAVCVYNSLFAKNEEDKFLEIDWHWGIKYPNKDELVIIVP